MKAHKVQQGEDMVTIAVKNGIADWEAIYNHSANQRLKEMRPDPMCLAPGDIVYIPDKEPMRFNVSTNQSHTIKIPVPKVYFSTQLVDSEDKPFAGTKFKLEVKNQEIEGSSDGDGLIECQVPFDAKTGKLTLWLETDDGEEEITYEVSIGELDPVDEITGQQQRLLNQGYDTGSLDGDYGPVTFSALKSYQSERGLEGTGQPGDQTNNKLLGRS